jgi:hypothetical protein
MSSPSSEADAGAGANGEVTAVGDSENEAAAAADTGAGEGSEVANLGSYFGFMSVGGDDGDDGRGQFKAALDETQKVLTDELMVARGWEEAALDAATGARVMVKERTGVDMQVINCEFVEPLPHSPEFILKEYITNLKVQASVDPAVESMAALEQVHERLLVVYEEDKLPFPMDKRDFVFAMAWSADSDGVTRVVLTSVEHEGSPAEATSGVRGTVQMMYVLEPVAPPAGESGDAFAPKSKAVHTRFRAITWFDLGGNVPSSWLNGMAGDVVHTMNAMAGHLTARSLTATEEERGEM